jgi:hypothetical protein
MNHSIRFFLGFSLLALFAFCGCKADPQPDIRAAQRAMEKARDFHSEELAAPEWKEALQAWQEAQEALKKGDPPIPYFRKAKTLFEKTIVTAEANGLVIQKKIEEIQNSINESYMKARAALKKGSIKPAIEKDLEPLLDDIAIDSSSVRDLIMHGDYTRAKELVLATQKKMQDAERLLSGQKFSQLEIEKRQ